MKKNLSPQGWVWGRAEQVKPSRSFLWLVHSQWWSSSASRLPDQLSALDSGPAAKCDRLTYSGDGGNVEIWFQSRLNMLYEGISVQIN